MYSLKDIKERISHKKVLYVEDDELLRETVSSFLNKFFNNLTISSNGQEGLDKFNKSPDYDVLITDIKMPVIDGVTMANEIKKLKSDIYIAYMSASDKINEVKRGDYNFLIKKPATFDTFYNLFNDISR